MPLAEYMNTIPIWTSCFKTYVETLKNSSFGSPTKKRISGLASSVLS